MVINTEQLKKECAVLGVELSPEMCDRFEIYAATLIEWNAKMNLTAITEPSEIVTRHFADSLSIFTAAQPAQGASLIDVGSGAGLPGLAVAIVRPDMKITLLDGTMKRITFLNEAALRMGLTVNAVHGRAEETAVRPDMREKYDFATARAVAAMNLLAEYCLGFVKVGGKFIAMKGPSAFDECNSATAALAKMGGKQEDIKQLALADGSERVLVTVAKITHTPTGFPRVSAKIAKNPL
mgnify:CR=1 FL=1